jgi:hypothetical protein
MWWWIFAIAQCACARRKRVDSIEVPRVVARQTHQDAHQQTTTTTSPVLPIAPPPTPYLSALNYDDAEVDESGQQTGAFKPFVQEDNQDTAASSPHETEVVRRLDIGPSEVGTSMMDHRGKWNAERHSESLFATFAPSKVSPTAQGDAHASAASGSVFEAEADGSSGRDGAEFKGTADPSQDSTVATSAAAGNAMAVKPSKRKVIARSRKTISPAVVYNTRQQTRMQSRLS